MEKFDCSFIINGKTYNFRKWKVKDRLALTKARDKSEVRSILVYNCLEDNTVVFDENQYQYALLQIREKSLQKKIHFNLTCEKCGKDYEHEITISDVFKPVDGTYGLIKVGDIEVEVQDVQNRKFYEDTILEITDGEERKLVDFALHIKSINNDENFDFKKVMEFIGNLDIDVFEQIINQWFKMQFRFENTAKVKCPYCENEESYVFDNLPGFFPESWGL